MQACCGRVSVGPLSKLNAQGFFGGGDVPVDSIVSARVEYLMPDLALKNAFPA